MKGLYQNELLKIIRQTGFKVVIIIVLALAVLTPVFLVAVDGLFDSFTYDDEDFYTEWAEEYEEGSIDRAFYLARAEASRFFTDNKLRDSWKYFEYGESYEKLINFKAGYTYYLRHPETDFNEIAGYFNLYDNLTDTRGEVIVPEPQIYEITSEEDFYGYDEYGYYDEPDIYIEKYGNVIPPTMAEAKTYITRITEYQPVLEDTILNATATKYYEDQKVIYQNAQKEYEEVYNKLKAEQVSYKKDSLEWLKADYSLAQWEVTMQKNRQLIKSCDFMIEKQDDPDSWRHTVAFDVMDSVYTEIGQTTLLSEPFYNELVHSDEAYMYGIHDLDQSYADYLTTGKPLAESPREALKMAEYSLAHDIPLTGSADMGAGMLKSSLSFTIGIVGIFMIVAIAMTVANEHSNGTIRLLLIRPRSRRKILLSKYLAVLTYSYGILLAALVWQFAVCALFCGGTELLSSTVCYIGGSVFAIPTFLWMFLYSLFLSLSGWMLMAITLLIAVASKRASLSILLPVIARTLFSGASMISILLVTELPKAAFLKYTFLPYLDLSNFVYSPVDRYLSGAGDLISGIFGMGEMTAYGFPLWVGLIWIIGLIALFSILSFTCFRKQQIKS